MIARVQKQLQDKERGFTLIELLVVIIIIGILAAIAIPAFLNQRQNAWASQVESDLRNAAIAAESYAVGNNGSYADLDKGELEDNGFNETEAVVVNVGASADDVSYTLTGKHVQRGGTWTYDSTEGTIDFEENETKGVKPAAGDGD